MATPTIPTGLFAWKKNEGDVGLNWTNVAGATSYEARFSADGLTWASAGTCVGDARYIRHNPAPSPLTKLTYQLRAVNADGASDWSAGVIVKNGDGTPLVEAAPTVDVTTYAKVAKEGETRDLGTTPQDVAYGAAGKFATKTGVTGHIAFTNAVFGDPCPGVVKAGYAKPTVPAKPAPPIFPMKHGAIADGSDPVKLGVLFKDVGWVRNRIWWTVNATTGAGNEDALKGFQAQRDNGISVDIVFTPTEGAASAVKPDLAIAQIQRSYPKGSDIEIVNEGNWGGYFPGGLQPAIDYADYVMERLGDDYNCSPPSVTGYFSSWPDWYKTLVIARGKCKKAKKLDFHVYSNKSLSIDYAVDPVGSQRQIDAYVADTEYALKQAKVVQQLMFDYTGRWLPIDITEFGWVCSDATDVVLSPLIYGLFKKYNVSSAFFIATCSYKNGVPKLPHSTYGWVADFVKNTRRQPRLDARRQSVALAK